MKTRIVAAALLLLAAFAAAAQDAPSAKWVTSWAASIQGPYPVGNPSAQPDMKLAIPSPETGARDQSFRLIVKPEIWGREARIRLSNVLGTHPVRFEDVFIGLHQGSAAVITGTNRPVTFRGRATITVRPGQAVWSDPVRLPFARNPRGGALPGRKIAVSFHVHGESGPMTWHAKALQTSYLTAPGSGSKSADESEAAFPFSTASWFFLDALDMRTSAANQAVVAFGDSITDGTLSTLNGDDRWPDVLARRLREKHGNRIAVVNAGIGGNQVIGPKEYAADKPFPGGPSALARLDRDVISLSGVSHVIWLEGINDFSKNGNASVEDVESGMKEGVARLRKRIHGVKVIGATLTPALGSTNASHGFPEQDEKRKALNEFIRTSGVFDAVVDFEKVTINPDTGQLRPEFVHNTTTGGDGDKLHPNRLGYLAMGMAFDLDAFKPIDAKPAAKKK
jgi:lysophospholipase L1-like esterase